MRNFVLLLLSGLLLANTPVLAQDQNEDEAVPRFEEIGCRYELPSGIDATCGMLVVPEDHSDPDGDTIRLAVIILHSYSDTPSADPIVYLTGGPGGVTLQELPFSFPRHYRAFLDTRDFIMFDQRGVGASKPALECPDLDEISFEHVQQDLSSDELLEIQQDALLMCHDTLVKDGVNLPAYTTAENAGDLNDLRTALGYESWNLLGVSYGTKLALTTMRDHPDGLRSVILDSVYPLQVDLYTELAPNQQRVFDLLFTACETHLDCGEAYPDLEDRFYATVEELNASPILIEGEHFWEGFDYSIHVTGDMVADVIFNMMYIKDEIPHIPHFIDTIVEGHEESLALIAQSQFRSTEGLSEAMYYTVQCSDEISFGDLNTMLDSAESLHQSLRADFTRNARNIFTLCDAWSVSRPAAIDNQPVSSNIPTLVLSGKYDPITPPSWGQLVIKDLQNGFFFVLPAVGHGVVRSDDCALEIALQFVDEPTTEPDSSCIGSLPGVTFTTPDTDFDH